MRRETTNLYFCDADSPQLLKPLSFHQKQQKKAKPKYIFHLHSDSYPVLREIKLQKARIFIFSFEAHLRRQTSAGREQELVFLKRVHLKATVVFPFLFFSSPLKPALAITNIKSINLKFEFHFMHPLWLP